MARAKGMPGTVAELRALIDTTWQPVVAALEAPATALVATGADGWSLKDHLAHIAAWERALLATLAGSSWQAALGVGGPQNGVDAINAVILERAKNRPAAEVLTNARETHARVLAAIAALSDEDLSRPNSSFEPGVDALFRDEPIGGWIAANTYQHYRDHQLALEALARGGEPAGRDETGRSL